MQDLQSQFHFQLSLLRLMNTQNTSAVSSAAPAEQTTEQEQLQDALARIADAIY